MRRIRSAPLRPPPPRDRPAVPGSSQTSGLGLVSFPNSGARRAQASFLRGLALLHSFEYDDAAEAFREAQRLDSAFAMAYWGEALTYDHPLWGEHDSTAAREALARLGATPEQRIARGGNARERAYLASGGGALRGGQSQGAAPGLRAGDGPGARRAFRRTSRPRACTRLRS